MYSNQNSVGTAAISSRRIPSLWGLALRPIGSEVFNGLAKVEWVDETNPPGGGVLATRGDEARLIAALEVRVTEKSDPTAAGFWRSRFDQE